LHMAQLMPLPLTVSCFSKIQIGFTFLVPAHPGSPGQRAIKRLCMCVCDLQVVPLFEATLELPDHKGSNATGDLVFLANIPPLGFTTYFVKVASPGEGNSNKLLR